MQRLARWIVRWTIIVAAYFIVGIPMSSLTLLLWATLGYPARYDAIIWVYTFMVFGTLGTIGASMLVDRWQAYSPLVTTQQLLDGWNWWKRLLRDPLRHERSLR